MMGILADTGKGLLVCELHCANPQWCILGDILDSGMVGLFNPFLPPITKFISPYYDVVEVSEVASTLREAGA